MTLKEKNDFPSTLYSFADIEQKCITFVASSSISSERIISISIEDKEDIKNFANTLLQQVNEV